MNRKEEDNIAAICLRNEITQFDSAHLRKRLSIVEYALHQCQIWQSELGEAGAIEQLHRLVPELHEGMKEVEGWSEKAIASHQKVRAIMVQYLNMSL